jgi:hypothetical protein
LRGATLQTVLIFDQIDNGLHQICFFHYENENEDDDEHEKQSLIDDSRLY